MSTYDALRRECRTLESLLDTKLASYARLASTIGREPADIEASGSADRWSDLEEEVDGLLEKLTETNDRLAATLNDPDAPPSQAMIRTVERHRSVLDDYVKDSRRTKSNVKAALERENLLSGVRNDINTYKNSAGESLLAERGRIDTSHRMADELLDQAYETRADLGRQRSTLSGINTRMVGVLNSMPGINNLLSMIKTRRRRDSLILGGVIAICVIFLLNTMFR